jgi:hypothetical protein
MPGGRLRLLRAELAGRSAPGPGGGRPRPSVISLRAPRRRDASASSAESSLHDDMPSIESRAAWSSESLAPAPAAPMSL